MRRGHARSLAEPHDLERAVGAVDARMLGEHVGHLTLDDMRLVDEALELILDLD